MALPASDDTDAGKGEAGSNTADKQVTALSPTVQAESLL